MLLPHHITPELLERCYHRQRSDSAVGVDGVTKYACELGSDENLRDLYERLRDRKYHHQPIKRVNILKGDG